MHNHMMVKDALDEEIEAKRRECDALRIQLGHLEFELQTLQRAAGLRPNGIAGRLPVQTEMTEVKLKTHSRKGRQPGAISKNWREILRRVRVHYPDGALAEDLASYGSALGLPNLRPTDARQQAEKYIEYGYVERVGDRYKVTDVAIERFGALRTHAEASDPEPLSESSEEKVYADAA